MLRHLGLCIVLLVFGVNIARADENIAKGRVIVESPIDSTLSYKKRRSTHGALFSVSTETFDPVDYQSQFGDVLISDIIGSETISLVGVELGYKYNVSVGSAAVLVGYSQGGASSGSRGLQIKKKSLSFNVALDGILEEPWVVPYFQVGANEFEASEDKGSASTAASANISYGLRYGLLFQLDWIDKDARGDSAFSSGLENTFIDVYYATYVASSSAQDPNNLGSAGDPNLGSTGQVGVGLKLEF